MRTSSFSVGWFQGALGRGASQQGLQGGTLHVRSSGNREKHQAAHVYEILGPSGPCFRMRQGERLPKQRPWPHRDEERTCSAHSRRNDLFPCAPCLCAVSQLTCHPTERHGLSLRGVPNITHTIHTHTTSHHTSVCLYMFYGRRGEEGEAELSFVR